MKRKSRRPGAQMRAKAATRKTRPKAPTAAKQARRKSSRDKVRAYRERMRVKGMRLVQMWVPDTRTSESAAEARRPSLRAERGDSAAIRRAWAEALKPREPAKTIHDIADLIGSVDGPEMDMRHKDEYLRAMGYGRKRHR